MSQFTILVDGQEYFVSSSVDECISTLKELQREENQLARRNLESNSVGSVYVSKSRVYTKLASGDWLCVATSSGDTATVSVYDMASFLAEGLLTKAW